MIKKYKLYLSKIGKIFLKKTHKVNKIKTKTVHTEFKSFYYTAFAGIILIIFFMSAPKTIQLTSQLLYTPKIIENTSKLDLERTLEGKILKLKPIIQYNSYLHHLAQSKSSLIICGVEQELKMN